MKYYDEIRRDILNRRSRSEWAKGVKEYALELLEEAYFTVDMVGKNVESVDDLRSAVLHGLEDFKAYSYSGRSLVYSCQIAERLCTSRQIAKYECGLYKYNFKEEWLDVQARALVQAFELLKRSWINITTADPVQHGIR